MNESGLVFFGFGLGFNRARRISEQSNQIGIRHWERSEAIHSSFTPWHGLLRRFAPRNDDRILQNASERFRRQFHGGRASGLDARKMHRRFRQHPLHEEAAGYELGGQIGGGAAARHLVLHHLGHPRPHIGEGDEAE